MKLSDLLHRGQEKRKRGQSGPPRFVAALKGRSGLLLICVGGSQEEADAALLERIRVVFRGDSTPFVLTFRDSTVLAWRQRDDWAIGYVRLGHTVPTGITLGDWKTREEAERQARLSLAMGEWDGEEEASPVIVHREDRDYFAAWAKSQKRFQRAYRLLRQHGWTDPEAHSMSGGIFSGIAAERMAQLGDPRRLLAEAGIETL